MHELNRRHFNLSLFAALGALTPIANAYAGNETLRVICGYPPGGSVDVVSRTLADKLSRLTGVQAIVENRPGASGRLAVSELKKAPPDGRHLLLTPASVLTLYPHVYQQLGYNVFMDVQPVCTVAATAFALAVGPKVPTSVTDFASLVRWCRSNRAFAQCGNPGAGSLPHFMAILVAREAGIEFDHVPYKGGLAAMQAVAAGDLAAGLATEASARALRDAGKLRVIATTGAGRTSAFPDVPTFMELGHAALVQREWFGVFAPGATPSDRVATAADSLLLALSDADVRETWARQGLQVDALPPQQLRAALRREHDFWGPLVKQSGFAPES